jgi:hypothetical protein
VSREQELTVAGAQLLGRFCTNIEREYPLDNGYRIDLKGELPNGQWALVEVKGFDDNLTPFIDAVFQAKSYADAIKYPVFIGPVYGNPSEIAHGSHTNALGAIHLMAGRMNVGFLVRSNYDEPMLLLRGQVIADSAGPRPNFASMWSYIERFGSRQARSN